MCKNKTVNPLTFGQQLLGLTLIKNNNPGLWNRAKNNILHMLYGRFYSDT